MVYVINVLSKRNDVIKKAGKTSCKKKKKKRSCDAKCQVLFIVQYFLEVIKINKTRGQLWLNSVKGIAGLNINLERGLYLVEGWLHIGLQYDRFACLF